jgi:hypothetical protein
MNPELRFNSIVISITTAFVFLVWLGLNQIIMTYPVSAVVLSGLLSLGTYRLLTRVFMAFFRNIKIIKRFILGPCYMEGTWVGFFVGHQNKIRFFVETFEQDLSRTVIRGRVFRDNGSYHGSWIAEDATIDSKRAKLTYHYQTDLIGSNFINPGIASFDIERPAPHKAPLRMIGFSSDLFNPHKLMAFEEKASNDTMMENHMALEKAKEVYEKNKGYVQSTSPKE